ncbi:hypothetical protein GF402_09545 [Candidatus Fermentibacteria bacterium]|nr:hypothetical protein [Candidatus Fermentibacteria bacterium]
MKASAFWIIGVLQSVALGFVVYLVFRGLNMINGSSVIGADTQLALSIALPLFLLLTEYSMWAGGTWQGRSG